MGAVYGLGCITGIPLVCECCLSLSLGYFLYFFFSVASTSDPSHWMEVCETMKES